MASTEARSRRTVAIIVALLVVALVGVGVFFVLTSDSGGAKKHTRSTTSTGGPTPSTSSSSSTSTTTPSRNTTTTTPVPNPNDPASYAQALYSDWKANDQSAASLIATQGAVQQMFSRPWRPIVTSSGTIDPYRFRACSGAAGHLVCAWTAPDVQLLILVSNGTGGPVEVDGVQRTTGSG